MLRARPGKVSTLRNILLEDDLKPRRVGFVIEAAHALRQDVERFTGFDAWVLGLMSAQAQASFIPSHDGQPSRRSAWSDPGVNARWGDFYSNTAETLETAYVRPRHSGYIAFQTKASALLREAATRSAPC